MNIIINLLLLFFFLIVSSFFNIPDYTNKRYLTQKALLFLIVFCIQFLILLIANILSKKVINIYDMALNCLQTALIAVLGYTLFLDTVTQYDIRKNLEPMHLKLNITIMIVLFIALIKTIGILFTTPI